VQLFYLINGWAGRSEWLDGALRFFYVGAVPLLWTALAALLIFAPRPREAGVPASRTRIALASLLSLAVCALIVWLVHLVQTQLLNGAPISPRPFMTHWTNALIVEPNDNTFPCFEVMLAAAAATFLWAARPGAGVLGWLAVSLLGFARIFCGMNYPGDVFAGAFLGGAIGLVSLAALGVPLQLPALKANARRWSWRVSHQAAFGTAALVGFVLFFGYALTTTSPHASKFKSFWKTPVASAAPSTLSPNATQKLATATLSGIHEGEGVVVSEEDSGPMSEPGKLLLASRAARLDGHLPLAEKALARALSTPGMGHRVIGVNVAQVRAGNSAYRCAAIRFEVVKTGVDERRRVAETAALCVKRAFHIDGQLQHVDVLGIDLRPEAATPPAGRAFSQSESSPHSQDGIIAPRHGVRLVFTASVERGDLIVENKPAWVNWSGLDGGAWLRARSALYIDDEVLPAAAPSIPVKKASPTAAKAAPQKIVPKTAIPKKAVSKKAPQKSVAPRKKSAVVRKRSTPRRKRYRRKKRRSYRRAR
jgi:membrane-associated phospholipid phosphatase